MDTSLYTPPPSLSPQRSHSLSRVIGVVLIIVLIIAAALAYRWYKGPLQSSGIAPAGYRIALADDALPLSNMHVIESNGKNAPQLLAKGQGTAVLVDAVSSKTTDYFLISDPSFSMVNLYSQDRNKQGAGLAQITHSNTQKYGLSYDELSNTFAYAAASSSTTHVIVTTQDGKETDMGKGTDPTLLSGAFYVIYRDGTSLMLGDLTKHRSHAILNIKAGVPFAVDVQNNMVALYDPAASSIEYYSVANMATASFKSAEKIAQAPNALAYLDGALVRADIEGGVAHLTGKTQSLSVPAITDLLGKGTYRMTLYHD